MNISTYGNLFRSRLVPGIIILLISGEKPKETKSDRRIRISGIHVQGLRIRGGGVQGNRARRACARGIHTRNRPRRGVVHVVAIIIIF